MTTPDKNNKLSIRNILSAEGAEGAAFRNAVASVLPKHLAPERFLRIAIAATTRTPKLLQCDRQTFFGALLTLSQLGIEPDGRRAHLIPFENRKRGFVECQLIIDYKGLAELAMRSGVVSKLHADVVCEEDEFEYDRGELKRHLIQFRKPRGAAYAAYALCKFKDGSEKVEVMSRDEIEAIRKRSRAGSSGPWITDPNEMWKKTVFRRLSKWLPLSPEFRDAVEADDDGIEQANFQSAKPVFSADDAAAGFLASPEPELSNDGATDDQGESAATTTTTETEVE